MPLYVHEAVGQGGMDHTHFPNEFLPQEGITLVPSGQTGLAGRAPAQSLVSHVAEAVKGAHCDSRVARSERGQLLPEAVETHL